MIFKETDLTGFKYAWYKEGSYSINTKSYLTLGRGKANETEIEESWMILPGEYNHMTVKVLDQKNIIIDGQMKPFYEILGKVNKATDTLNLFLAPDKSIDKVENKEEILAKWKEIKKELYFYELIRSSYGEMINIYDKEFHKIDNNIKHNMLYQILFYPLPVFNEEEYIQDIPKRTALSTLFPGKEITYDSQYEISKSEEGGFHVSIKGKGKNVAREFDDIYENSYQKTLKIPMDYGYSVEGEYTYNKDSVLSEVIFHIKEQLNTEMLYVCRYHIKLNKP
ncbi:hypothetical protein IQ37_17835 [Chryseobacterium piperi]|uniref:Uncharacterized protein n=1 Tax=Chryseobacterium piperi TaxID=558152 RepID=A0A086AIJ0_9FLAO|nr:hypothetical protein [Chryseobacterium piperi]ASW73719.1 hypothetical protein CJF12_05040 [Chryseobacterium piperi]KFF16504.1 hypothetical protein IQ37_17835 [Chryseobacterium piperi]